MSVKKILLKDDAGRPLSSLTLPYRSGGTLTLPKELQVDAYEEGEIRFPKPNGEIRVVGDPPTLSLIGRWKGVRVFASTLPEEKANFAKWKLLSAVEEGQKALEILPKSPLEQPHQKPIPPAPQEEETHTPQEPITPQEDTELPPAPMQAEASFGEKAAPSSALSRAEALLQSGEAFDLFNDLMPGSRWAKIKEEEYEYLVGITGDTPPRVLYGIAGMLDYPPDEDRLWSFFPIDEEGEEGYYLTEAMVN